MKNNKRLCRPLALALLLALGVGCSTTQTERSQRAVSDLQQLHKLLAAGDEQVSTLNKSLAAVAKAKPDDLRGTFAAFEKELQRTQKLAAKVSDQIEDVKDNAEAYLDTWKKQAKKLGNADLKTMSLERQQLVQQDFGRMMAAVNAMSTTGKAYGADLKDLQTFLGNDMTRAGSALAKPFLTKVQASSEPFLKSLRAAQVEVDQLATVLQPK